MTILSWFNKPKPKSDAHPGRESGQRTAVNSPARGGDYAPSQMHEHSSDRLKTERAKMREQLYSVVRESMVRVGILSNNFKFKVLATDPKGQRFIVMMDLPEAFGADISQLAEIEPVICRTAKMRHNIMVSAVYWRADVPVPTGRAPVPGAAAPAHTPAPPPPTPAPVATVAPSPVAFAPQATPNKPGFEPVLADEVSALKRVLAAGGSVAAIASSTDTNPALLTGYENTEIIESEMPVDQDTQATQIQHEPEDDPYPLLSPTQYGDMH